MAQFFYYIQAWVSEDGQEIENFSKKDFRSFEW